MLPWSHPTQVGALDVAQELGAQAGAYVRTLDEAGNVGHRVGLLVGFLPTADHGPEDALLRAILHLLSG